MGLNRYIFKTGLDIVAPLKCGTRWLKGLDVENRIDTYQFGPTELDKNIHSGTTFIWRGVMEHFLSAIGTEFLLHPNWDISDIIARILDGKCAHWYPHLYKELYPIWEKTGFRFYKLRALSELTPSTGELEWNTTMYRVRLPKEHITIEDSLNTLSPNQWNEIRRLIGEEEKWLKWMLKSQYSGKSWKEYSDLEDSLLEMKCKVMDLETELKRTKILLSKKHNKLI